MASVSTGMLLKMEKCIEKYLIGERNSKIICTTPKIVRILRKKYPKVKLVKREQVNKELNLNVYVIMKGDS